MGKTSTAIELAPGVDAEVVSADSMCVYRHMDIGTAKPTLEERRGVPLHLIDVVDPDEPYSVARFLADSNAAIRAIWTRGRAAIVAGGTGYWVSALLGRATSSHVPPDPELRAQLDGEPVEALARRLAGLDAAARVDARNPRRLIRAIEVVTHTGRPYAEALKPAAGLSAQVFGLTLPRDLLYTRINERYDGMVEAGWLDEVRDLLAHGYGRELPAMRGLGYRELSAHLAGELSFPDALERAKARCRRYARGQYAWFRPDDPSVRWIDAREDVVGAIERSLSE